MIDLDVKPITIVVAESFARIFRQNMHNCGMMAIELSKETIDELFTITTAAGGHQNIRIGGTADCLERWRPALRRPAQITGVDDFVVHRTR